VALVASAQAVSSLVCHFYTYPKLQSAFHDKPQLFQWKTKLDPMHLMLV
jgi:hypothetical protein